MTSTSDAAEWTRIFDQAERIPVLVAHYGPTAALATGLAVLAFKIARATLRRWQTQRLARDARLIIVSVPPQVDPASAPAWWAHQTGLLAPACEGPRAFRTAD